MTLTHSLPLRKIVLKVITVLVLFQNTPEQFQNCPILKFQTICSRTVPKMFLLQIWYICRTFHFPSSVLNLFQNRFRIFLEQRMFSKCSRTVLKQNPEHFQNNSRPSMFCICPTNVLRQSYRTISEPIQVLTCSANLLQTF